MYDSLPKREKTIHIDMTGLETGVHYKGDFVVRTVLSMSGKHALELEKTRLMADYANPSRGLVGISITLSNIRAKTIKAPEWWVELGDGSEVLDEEVVLEIYDQIMQAENEWREAITKKAKKDTEELEEEEKAAAEAEGK